jgi:hypothetical protein
MAKALILHRPSGTFARFLVPLDLRSRMGQRFLVRRLPAADADGVRLVAATMGTLWVTCFDGCRRMLVKQLEFINTHQDAIKDRAKRLYGLVAVDKHFFYSKLSCDFKALEQGGSTFEAPKVISAVAGVTPAAANKPQSAASVSVVNKGIRATLGLKPKPSDMTSE